jgi:hypothetical protein
MIRTAFMAALALIALATTASARQRPAERHPNCDRSSPCGRSADFLAGVRSIDVNMTRDKARRHRPAL